MGENLSESVALHLKREIEANNGTVEVLLKSNNKNIQLCGDNDGAEVVSAVIDSEISFYM